MEDPAELWLSGLENSNTRDTYRQALKRLSLVSGLTPRQMLEQARVDVKTFWVSIKADAGKLKPHVKTSVLSAVRRRNYLRANGEFLPYDRIIMVPRSRKLSKLREAILC